MNKKAKKIALGMVMASACGIIGVVSCKKKVPVEKVEINTKLEMAPPIASEIEIKVLEKATEEGNVLFVAKFDKKNVPGKFHALSINDEILTLRDDGNGGDEKADDGKFSIIVNENLADFKKDMATNQRMQMMALEKQQSLFIWQNRNAIDVTPKIRELLASDFINGNSFKFDPGILFSTIPDPLLTDHSLMITDLGVVEDLSRIFNPCTNAGDSLGAWTFAKLISDMANTPATGVSAEDFTKNWLENWLIDQNINGDDIPKRTQIFNAVIKPWIIKSNPGIASTSITLTNWKTKRMRLKFAPFKLLAIVNRLDLRGNSGYRISNAGEGRFVFGVLNSTCTPLTGPGKFTVILEYGIPIQKCETLKEYAQKWIDLKNETIGSPQYNNALQKLTDVFAKAGAGGSKPNGSAINQIRTNELALGSPWELREFNVDKSSHQLVEVTVKQEPAKRFNRLSIPTGTDIATLAKFVNDNESEVLNNTYEVLPTFNGTTFLGGKAHTESSGHFWDASTSTGTSFINSDNARHNFSLNTCSGCHGGEGKTAVGNLINDPAGVSHNAFLQIAPQPFGTKATLAAFLTGDPSQSDKKFRIVDPANRPTGSPTTRKFNDLERRNVDLQNLAKKSCKSKLNDLIVATSFKPIKMTH